MIKGETSKGFSFEVEEDVFDDWELAELLAGADNNSLSSMIGALKKILGEEGYNSMKEFYRDESGKIKTSTMSEAIKEIMEIVGEKSKAGKNS